MRAEKANTFKSIRSAPADWTELALSCQLSRSTKAIELERHLLLKSLTVVQYCQLETCTDIYHE